MTTTPLNKLGHDAIKAKGWIGAHRWLILRRISQIAIIGLFLLGPVAGFTILRGNLSSSMFLEKIPMTDPLLFLQMLAAGFFAVASTAVIGAAVVLAFYLIVGGKIGRC